jgi:hypothetical protein
MAPKKRNPNGSGSISQRRDGRYELKVFVDTPDGRCKRISVYGATWEEADAERTRLKEQQRKGIPVESTTITVAQYTRYWLAEIAKPAVRETRCRRTNCWCGCTSPRRSGSASCELCRRSTFGPG